MFLVIRRIVGINEDVVKVYNYETSSMSAKISFTKRWNAAGALVSPKGMTTPFKRSIVGPEGCFPFITFGYAYKMISMSKIKFGVDAGGARGVEEIRNEWKGVTVFLGYLV